MNIKICIFVLMKKMWTQAKTCNNESRAGELAHIDLSYIADW